MTQLVDSQSDETRTNVTFRITYLGGTRTVKTVRWASVPRKYENIVLPEAVFKVLAIEWRPDGGAIVSIEEEEPIKPQETDE